MKLILRALSFLWLSGPSSAGYLRGSSSSSRDESKGRRLTAQQRKGIPIPSNGPIKCQWVRSQRALKHPWCPQRYGKLQIMQFVIIRMTVVSLL
jgi:hypothetical protein